MEPSDINDLVSASSTEAALFFVRGKSWLTALNQTVYCTWRWAEQEFPKIEIMRRMAHFKLICSVMLFENLASEQHSFYDALQLWPWNNRERNCFTIRRNVISQPFPGQRPVLGGVTTDTNVRFILLSCVIVRDWSRQKTPQIVALSGLRAAAGVVMLNNERIHHFEAASGGTFSTVWPLLLHL